MLKSNQKKSSSHKISRSNKSVYLDNASATPIDKDVLKSMNKISMEDFANAMAIHELGEKSKKILENSRTEVAKILNAHNEEIIFTSGATESNNFAILGVLEKNQDSFSAEIPHIITTNIEHPSVLATCKYLEESGKAEVTYIPVEMNGIVDPKKIKKAIKPNTVLISVMYANNEIGTIQPIYEIAKEIRHYKKTMKISAEVGLPQTCGSPTSASCPIFHTDATQAINYLSINVEKLGVDLMSFNAGKIYGPKGVGVLYKKRNIKLSPIIHGGEQENGLRSGTENLVGIFGLTKALEVTEEIKEKETIRLIKLRDYFIKKILKISQDADIKIKINGDLINRLPNNINISINKIPSDLILIELSTRGVYVSEKSACKSGDKAQSHVIEAIGNPKICKKESSLRFSLGRYTEKKDLDYALKQFLTILKKLKKWYD